MSDHICASYLGQLQGIYHVISNRGILIDTKRLDAARIYIDSEIAKELATIKKEWRCHVYLGASNNDGSKDSINLNSYSGSRTPLEKLKSLGYKVPKISKRNEDTGEYESKESLAELALQRMLASSGNTTPGGDTVIKAILRIRELVTLKTRYINARLYTCDGYSYYLSNYNVAGTTTGRRSSRKHTFGFGNNAQNLPTRGTEAAKYKRCFVARPSHIFLFVDQMQAEEWPVSALAQNTEALADLEAGVDRHKKLASAIFNVDVANVTDIQRFLGKKVRHARNYGMRGNKMSDSLAAEGYALSAKACQDILDMAAKIDPSVEAVFHEYIKQELYNTRTLHTPFGRERQFFGLRGGSDSNNQKIFREAYAYIPQSTVGDNTGFAVYHLEQAGTGSVVQEGHDSIIQEPPDRIDFVWQQIQLTIAAFDREIIFHNGIKVRIPVEGKIGYDFDKQVTLKSSTGSKRLHDISYKDLQQAYAKLKSLCNREEAISYENEMNHETVGQLDNGLHESDRPDKRVTA
jgi:hypothetical protein